MKIKQLLFYFNFCFFVHLPFGRKQIEPARQKDVTLIFGFITVVSLYHASVQIHNYKESFYFD